MCAKREHRDVYQPIADLHEEFAKHAANTDGAVNPLPDLNWIGPVAFYGLLGNV